MEPILQSIIEKLENSLQRSSNGNDAVFQSVFSYSFIAPDNTPDRELKRLKNPLEGVDAVLKLLEKYPDIYYFYEPDYLCMYLEHLYGNGYEELLFQSVQRRPFPYTLHLLHRVINDHENPHGHLAFELMKYVADHENYPAEIRTDARERVDSIREEARPILAEPSNYRIVSLQEAVKEFDLEVWFQDEEIGNGDRMIDTYSDPLVVIFDGDTEFTEDIHFTYEMLQSLNELGKQSYSDFQKLLLGKKAYGDRILIINGNLKAPKIDMGSLSCLFILGNLECEKFKFYQNHPAWIQGNLNALQAILGSASDDDDCFLEEKGEGCARIQGKVYAPRVQTWYMRLEHLNWTTDSGEEFAEDEELEHEDHFSDPIWRI